MYIILLIIVSFLFISVFSTNWPVKLYHYYFLKQLADRLGVPMATHGLLFSGVYSELAVNRSGREWKVRFLEGAVDSLYSNSGLEIRIQSEHDLVVELYRPYLRKREWGDFKQVLTGDDAVDRAWLILSPEPGRAAAFLNRSSLNRILSFPYLEQVLINRTEVLLQLRHIYSVRKLYDILEELTAVFGKD